VSFDDIVGMEEAKAAIREMIIYPLREPEKAKAMKLKPGGGVILYGPPGTGKTMFGKAIAHEINAAFFYASGAQLRSKWHGESEQNLSRLLKEAQAKPVAVLFLDEIDGLLPRRTSGSSVVDNRIVTQFLADVGGFRESENTLLILGATNEPWSIDDAVFRTGRFDEKIYIGLPDEAARAGLLAKSFDGVPMDGAVSLAEIAAKLAGYTGSDIVGIAEKARKLAFCRAIESGADAQVAAEDVAEAVRMIPSSVTPALIAKYDRFKEQRYQK
jgi:transitional endoplasmic reticulum ATPase